MAVTVSFPSGGINTLKIHTADVGISFDFSIFILDSDDGSLDLCKQWNIGQAQIEEETLTVEYCEF